MYNRYFGFLESPFSVTPDPRFFYTNPVYQEAYATLRYGIEAKKGLVVVTGEVGTGKTTLLRRLLHNFETTRRLEASIIVKFHAVAIGDEAAGLYEACCFQCVFAHEKTRT